MQYWEKIEIKRKLPRYILSLYYGYRKLSWVKIKLTTAVLFQWWSYTNLSSFEFPANQCFASYHQKTAENSVSCCHGMETRKLVPGELTPTTQIHQHCSLAHCTILWCCEDIFQMVEHPRHLSSISQFWIQNQMFPDWLKLTQLGYGEFSCLLLRVSWCTARYS